MCSLNRCLFSELGTCSYGQFSIVLSLNNFCKPATISTAYLPMCYFTWSMLAMILSVHHRASPSAIWVLSFIWCWVPGAHTTMINNKKQCKCFSFNWRMFQLRGSEFLRGNTDWKQHAIIISLLQHNSSIHKHIAGIHHHNIIRSDQNVLQTAVISCSWRPLLTLPVPTLRRNRLPEKINFVRV